MGGQACKCDWSNGQDNGENFDLQTAVEVRLEPSVATRFDPAADFPSDDFDSVQWAETSDPCADAGIAANSASLCDSWVERFTDQEIQQLEEDARKHIEECHDLTQPCTLGTMSSQPSCFSSVGNDSSPISLGRVLSKEFSEASTQTSEHNFLYSTKDGFQEASNDVHISDQSVRTSTIHAVQCKGDLATHSDSLVQTQGSEAGSCQGHGLKRTLPSRPCAQPASFLVQAEGGLDVTMRGSLASKLHHISVWYHVGATEEDLDLSRTEALQATGHQSAGCSAVRHPPPLSSKGEAVQSSSRRPLHAKPRQRAASKEEDVLLW